ncbi:unnamed protein product [Phytophthora lilii]|uniref:Unnamed protein product n=1 Tax=Phytophthora lilii TaxID=2077276 RepID=A0A9W6X6W4_9STRA|nr:unnamed protein product [Phytophthora lilii]
MRLSYVVLLSVVLPLLCGVDTATALSGTETNLTTQDRFLAQGVGYEERGLGLFDAAKVKGWIKAQMSSDDVFKLLKLDRAVTSS